MHNMSNSNMPDKANEKGDVMSPCSYNGARRNAGEMLELQITKKRPEDRRGLRPGSRVSALNVELFRRFAATLAQTTKFQRKG